MHVSDVENFPEPPSTRNAAEEVKLKERFEEYWRARLDHNWDKLHEMVDPRDRSLVPVEDIETAETQFVRQSYKLYWVEVIGNRGRTRALYQIKIGDKHVQLPPEQRYVTESWVKYEGQWYLNFE